MTAVQVKESLLLVVGAVRASLCLHVLTQPRRIVLLSRTVGTSRFRVHMPSSAPLPTTKDMGPFREFYRFKDGAKEEMYQEQSRPGLVAASRIFALSHVTIYLCLPLNHILSDALPSDVLLGVLPSVAVGLLMLALSFVPPMQRRVKTVIAVAAPLVGLTTAFSFAWHQTLLARNATQFTLPGASSSAGAAHHEDQALLLEQFVMHHTAGVAFLEHYITFLPYVSLLGYVGWCPHVAFSLNAMEVAFWGAVPLLSGTAVLAYVLRQCAVLFLILGTVFVWALLHFSRRRRLAFSLRLSFEEAWQAAEAGRKADSILNHTLKNTMADAAGEIDMFLGSDQAQGPGLSAKLQQAAGLPPPRDAGLQAAPDADPACQRGLLGPPAARRPPRVRPRPHGRPGRRPGAAGRRSGDRPRPLRAHPGQRPQQRIQARQPGGVCGRRLGLGQSPQILLLSVQLVASIGFLPLMKTHPSRCVGPWVLFLHWGRVVASPH